MKGKKVKQNAKKKTCKCVHCNKNSYTKKGYIHYDKRVRDQQNCYAG